MDFKSFKEQVCNMLGYNNDHLYYMDGSRPVYSSFKTGKQVEKNCIAKTWTLGGVSGGSCWDTGDNDPHYPLSAEPEPEFEELDKILEKFCPNLSYMQYKKYARELVKRTSYSQNEYYGNHTDYGVKYIDLREVYAFFVNEGVITKPDKEMKKLV